MKETKYNHDRPLNDFEDQLKIIREHGFKPISVTQMELEDTFVFETKKEANKAFNELEVPKKYNVVGWWFGKNDFMKAVRKYEKRANTDRNDEFFLKMKIYWL